MFYGVDVNHARLFPLGNTLADTWTIHSAPCPRTVSTGHQQLSPRLSLSSGPPTAPRAPATPLVGRAMPASPASFNGSRGPALRLIAMWLPDARPRASTVPGSRLTVRSAILRYPASSYVRLAHLEDFREWITRPVRSRLRFRVTMQRRASQA